MFRVRSPHWVLGVVLIPLVAWAWVVRSVPGPSRALEVGLAGAALAGVMLAVARKRVAAPQSPRRLELLSQVRLSPRCTLALVQVDGTRCLVLHGEPAQVLPLADTTGLSLEAR